MDPNNPVQNGQNPNPAQPNPALRPMNEPHIPITEDEMNHQMHQNSPRSGINTLLTLSSLLVLAGIVGITLWLYIQNKTNLTKSATTDDTSKTSAPEQTNPASIHLNALEQQEANIKKYGVVCRKFTSVEEALQTPEIACILDLSGQNLTALPNDVLKLTNLNDIYLNNNDFTNFPTELYQLKGLVKVDLSDNNISSLPKDLREKMPAVRYILLEGNSISGAEVKKFENLSPDIEA